MNGFVASGKRLVLLLYTAGALTFMLLLCVISVFLCWKLGKSCAGGIFKNLLYNILPIFALIKQGISNIFIIFLFVVNKHADVHEKNVVQETSTVRSLERASNSEIRQHLCEQSHENLNVYETPNHLNHQINDSRHEQNEPALQRPNSPRNLTPVWH